MDPRMVDRIAEMKGKQQQADRAKKAAGDAREEILTEIREICKAADITPMDLFNFASHRANTTGVWE